MIRCKMNKFKIAILANCTIDFLAQYLEKECIEIDIHADIYKCGFNQYVQEILDKKSQLYKFNPEIIIIFLEGQILMPRWFEFTTLYKKPSVKKSMINEIHTDILSLIEKLDENTNSIILMNNFKLPYHSPLGILDNKFDYGLKKMIHTLNEKLENMFRNKDNCYLFDYSGVCSSFGQSKCCENKLYYGTKSTISIPFAKTLAKEYLRYIIPYNSLKCKCLVLDLDNTLWGGVAGEDGLPGIKLDTDGEGRAFYDFQKEIINLYNKGIMLAVCSKNNEKDALEIITKHPHMLLKKKHFSVLRINWEDKCKNIMEIANELNIGIDSLVFFDDSPFEREYVKSMLPRVKVVEVPEDSCKYTDAIKSIPWFESLDFTEEDLKRNDMYMSNKKREEFSLNFNSKEDYLNSLGTKITVEYANEFTIPRISQLTQKTNQFNMTTKRYTEGEIKKLLNNGFYVMCCIVEDKFGDNGITGVCIASPAGETAYLDTFLLSCRVLGRDVEKAFLFAIADNLFKKGFKKIRADFIKTQRNGQNQNFYLNSGFSIYKKEDNRILFELKAENPLTCPSHIQIKFQTEYYNPHPK